MNEDKEITLTGQSGYSSDMYAFMLTGGDMMVIYNQKNGPVYLTKQQAMEMFNLKEKE